MRKFFRKWLASLVLPFVLGLAQAQAFTHPSIPNSLEDLDTIKANLNREPWKSGYAKLAADGHSSLTYTMQGPFASVTRNPDLNLGAWNNDMTAVYNLAHMWYFTGNSAYAQKARDILIAWANTQTNMGGNQAGLALGDYAYRFGGGASILRGTWPGWTPADTAKVKNLFLNVYWPATANAWNVPGTFNKGLLNMSAGIAIAVFCDDTAKFNHVVDLYRTNPAAGLFNLLPIGETGETGRDAGHVYGGIVNAAFVSECIWKQGVDVYSDLDNRLLAAGEYYCRNTFSLDNPFVDFGTVDALYFTDAAGPYGANRAAFHIIQNAYKNRKNIPTPWIDRKLGEQWLDVDNWLYAKPADFSTATPLPAVVRPAVSPASSGLTLTTLGSNSAGSSSAYANGVWTVTGLGTGVSSDTTDDCQFAYVQMTGDCAIVAQVTSAPATTTSTKAGVMIRDNLSSTVSQRAWMAITSGTNQVQSRMNGATETWAGRVERTTDFPAGSGLPYWVKVERRGNLVTTYSSKDGTSWCPHISDYYGNLGATAYVGLFIASGSATANTTATFANVAFTGGTGGLVTTPAAPAAVFTSGSSKAITVRWLPSYGATGYDLLRSTTSGSGYAAIASDLGTDKTSYVDTTAVAGTTYYYVVQAKNAVGTSGNSPEFSAALLSAPMVNLAFGGTPSASANSGSGYEKSDQAFNFDPGTKWIVSATTGWLQYDFGSGNEQLVKRYTVSSADVAGRDPKDWQFQGSQDGSTWTTLDSQSGQVFANRYQQNVYNIGSTTAYRYYRINVTANNGDAYSLAIAELGLWSDSGRTFPDGRYRLVNRNSNKVVDVGATTNGTPLVQSGWNGADSQQWDIAWQGNGQYRATGVASTKVIDNGGTSNTGTNLVIQPSSGTTSQLWTIVPDSDGFYRIASANSGLVADVSGGSTADGANIVQSTYGGGDSQLWMPSIGVAPQPIPSTPTGLAATAASISQINLSWTASPGAISYTIKRAAVSGGPYTTVLAGVNTTNFSDTGLTSSTTYYYVVSAVNGSGESANSTQTSSTTLTAPPDAPTGLTTVLGSNQVTLSWTVSGGATSYTVKRATTIGGPYTTVASGVTATSYTDTGLTNGVAYYYVVSASNANGTGANSAEISATTSTLVVQLKFDESSGATAFDSSGRALNATLFNTPTFSAGTIGNALNFPATASQYAKLPNGITSGVNDFTVSTWVKLNAAANNNRIFDFGTGTNNYMEICPKASATGYMRYEIVSGGTIQRIDTTYTLPTGVWTHVALTQSGTTGTLYINGTAVGTNTGLTLKPSNLGTTTLNYIGRSQWSSDPYLNGALDDFRFYSQSMSSSEINALAHPAAGAPTQLAAALGDAQATLTWLPNATDTYTIKRSTTSGGPYTTVATGVTSLTYTDTGITNGTTYYYVVSGSNSSGSGPDSAEVSVTPSTLRLRLKFDESSGSVAADSSGTGRNATLVNSPTFAAGRLDNGLTLASASSQYATLPSGIVSGLTNFTVATWVNVNTFTSWQRIFDFGTGSTNYMFLTPQYSGSTAKLRFAIRANGGTEQNVSVASNGIALTAGSWTHVAVTRSGTTVSIYVNGALAGSGTITASPADLGTTTLNYLGKSQFGSDPYLNAGLDEFRVYTQALSSTEIASLAAPPAAPQNLAAASGPLTLNLTWSAVSNATRYTVKYATTSGGPYTTLASGLTGTSYLHSGLTFGSTYYYVVSAGNSYYDGPFCAELAATPQPPIPSAPTGLAATGAANTVTLSWTSSDYTASYNVKRATTSGGSFATIANVTDPSYTDTGATAGATYYYVVSAVNETGESANSTGASAYLGLPTLWAHSDVGTVALTGSSTYSTADDTFTVNGSGTTIGDTADSFQFSGLTMTGDGTAIARVAALSSTPANAKVGVVMREMLNPDAKSATALFDKALSVASMASRSTVGGSTTTSGSSAQTVPVWLKLARAGDVFTASCSADGVTWTSLGNATIPMNSSIYVGLAVCGGSASQLSTATFDNVSMPGWKPSAPLGVAASATTGQVVVNWAASNTATSYTLQRSTTSGSGYETLAGGLTATSYTDTDVTNGTTYHYVVTASNSVGTSPASAEGSARPLGAPTGLAATGGTQQIALTWTAATGATAYKVKRTTTSGSGYTTVAAGVTATSYTDTSLSDGTTYYYVVTSTGPNSESVNSSQASALTMPAAPTGLMATGGTQQAALSWTSTTGAASYNVKRATTSGGSYTTVAIGVTATDYTDTGLSSGTTYYYVVTAVNGTGESASSAEVGVLTLPDAPTGVTATAGNGQVALGWTASTGATGYTILRATSPTGSYTTVAAGLAGTSYTDTGLSNGTTYYYVVVATNASGSSSNSTQANGTTIPAVPTGLAGTPSSGQVSLTWTASTGATSYNVKRALTSGGSYTTLATGVTGTAYTDATVQAGWTYYYTVSAGNAVGESANAASVPVTTTTAPWALLKFDETGGTTAADATGNNQTGTLVNGPVWTGGKLGNAASLDGSNDHVTLPNSVTSNLHDFTVSAWVYWNGGNNWQRIFDFGTGTSTYMFLSPKNGATNTIRFAITTSGAGGEQKIDGGTALASGGWRHVAVTLSGTTGTLYVDGVQVGQNTAMTLRPSDLGATTLNRIGRSQYNDPYLNGRVDDFRIYAGALSSAEIAALAAPIQTTGLTATGGNGQVTLGWNATTGATSYTVRRTTTSGGVYAVIASGITATSYTNTGLSNGTTYYYVVTPANASGDGANSAEATTATIPAAPTGLTSTGGVGQIALTWSASTGATAYNVLRATSSNGSYTTIATGLAGTSYTDTGVASGTTYYYAVIATNGSGSSANSSQVNAITAPDAPGSVTATGGSTQITLSWTASTGAMSYNVLRATSSNGSYTTVATGLTGTSYTDTGLASGTTYYYTVIATNGSGSSANSSQVNAITAPDSPGSVTATAGNGQVSLSWASSTGATGYNVLRATSPNGSYTTIVSGVVGTSYTDTGLSNGTTYYYAVVATNGSGSSTNSSQVNAITAPAAPTGLAATSGTQQVALFWSASSGATSYTVKRSATSGSGYATIATGVTATNYPDTGLSDGTTYYYVVTAVNGSGESAGSAEVNAITTPAAPTGLAAMGGTQQAALSWSATTGAASYTVKRATTSGGSYTTVATGVTATSYTDTGLSSGTTYYYVVTAVNGGGESASSAEVGALTIPGAPTGITATAGNGQVALSWTASTGATSYTVLRATSSNGSYTTIATGVTGTSYTDTGLSNGTPYYYAVVATNGSGSSTNSSQVNAITAPAAPTGPAATPGTQQVALSWSASSGATSYTVKRSATSGSGYATVATGVTATSYTNTGLSNGTTYYYVVTAVNGGGESAGSTEVNATTTPAAPTGLAATGGAQQAALSWTASTGAASYTVKRSTTSGSGYTTVAAGVTATSYTDTGLSSGTTYYYVVTAVNGGGESASSAEVSTITIPGAPTGITATAGNGQVSLSWTASPGASSYTVLRATSPNGSYTTIATGVTGTSYTDTGLSNGTTYYYAVVATNGSGSSTNSSQVNAITAPAVPNGLAATPDNAQVSLLWNSSTGAATYNVLRSTTSGSGYTTVASGLTGTSYTDTGLTNNTTYYYVVSATNTGGTSASSGEASATPVALPSPWATADIGSTGATGSASRSPSGVFTVVGAGADIWNNADAFRYVYQTATGDCDITARVTAISNTNAWAKVGVMIRETLAAGSTHVSAVVTPGSGVSFQRRIATNGISYHTTTSGITAPQWVRVTRVGNVFTTYYSANGTSWTNMGSVTITMSTNVYIGLPVTSHVSGTLCTATIDNVTAIP